MRELLEFYAQLRADVIAESQGEQNGLGDFKENAFTRIVAADLEAAGVLESPTVCFYGDSVGNLSLKANGYSIPEEDTQLDIIVSSYFVDDEPRRLHASDVERSFNSAIRYFKAAIGGGFARMESGSDEFSMTRAIFDQRESIDRLRVILVTNGLSVQRKAREVRDDVGNVRISCEVWDLERLRRFRSSGSTHESIFVDLTKFDGGVRCSSISDASLGYETCVAILPGLVLFEWYDEYGSRLLELNVRSYLQARGKINKGILETLLSDPQRFLTYNNGITIVAEELGFDESGGRITSIKGLQIVNGGQTTASIHRAKNENRANLEHVFVQAKVTIVPADKFETVVPLISRYSNTQNKVSEVDLGANHAFHVGVERMSKSTWAPGEQSMWFYERARGSYQTERTKVAPAQRSRFDTKYPPDQRLSKEDLARYWNTWNGLPHVVSKGGQKNFSRFMDSLPRVENGWQPNRIEFESIIGKAILFRNVQNIAKELNVPAYKINIVTYTIALLVEKCAGRIDLQKIWERQEISSSTDRQIRQWLPEVASLLLSAAGSRNPTDWFKLEDCWRRLREQTADWQLSAEFTRELVAPGGVTRLANVQLDNRVARCIQTDAETWLKIFVWGTTSGQLSALELGVANTLAGYAAASWKRTPSPRQARHGVTMLDRYSEAQSAGTLHD